MPTNPKTIGESTMKEIQNLPDDNTLDELIVMAESKVLPIVKTKNDKS